MTNKLCYPYFLLQHEFKSILCDCVNIVIIFAHYVTAKQSLYVKNAYFVTGEW